MTILIAKCLNQIGNGDAQSVSDFCEILEGRVPFCTFDAAQVVSIQA